MPSPKIELYKKNAIQLKSSERVNVGNNNDNDNDNGNGNENDNGNDNDSDSDSDNDNLDTTKRRYNEHIKLVLSLFVVWRVNSTVINLIKVSYNISQEANWGDTEMKYYQYTLLFAAVCRIAAN